MTGASPLPSEARAPWSERLVDGACVAFALWTACGHAVVAGRGSLRQLVGLYALAALLGLAAWALLRRRRRRTSEPRAAPPRASNRPAAQIVGGLLGLAAALTLLVHGDAITLWWCAVGILGAAALLFCLPERGACERPRGGAWREAALWSLAAACVAITLVSHRPDMDDAFYVNMAVAAVDAPGRPLLREDTLLGIPGLPLHMPAHRFHTYELWNGALAFLTGVPAIYCFHWISASLAALLVPLAHARLFRLLTPRIWPWGVAGLVVVLVAAGETHRWYGNFAFVRLWQGKGIFLFAFLPLVYAYALRWALQPTAGRFALLAAAQIAAVGCSSSAIWAAPAAALAAMSCVLRPTSTELKVGALGALASLYPLAVGVSVKSAVEAAVVPLIEPAAPGQRLADAFSTSLGESNLQLVGICAVLVAWACQGRELARRFAIAVPLAATAVLLNPYWEGWVTRHVTGPSYWRGLWILPIPLLIALVLTSPLQLEGGRARRAAGRVVCVLLFAGFALFVPRYSGLSERNRAAGGSDLRLGWPRLKVPEPAYRWARLLRDQVPPGSTVAASREVSAWLPTLHHHPYPLVVRDLYLDRQHESLGSQEVGLRRLITSYVSGEDDSEAATTAFREGLERYDLQGVFLRNSDAAVEARQMLRAAGFERVALGGGEGEIWVRSPKAHGSRSPSPGSDAGAASATPRAARPGT